MNEYTINYDRDWTWIHFPSKPAESVLSALRTFAKFSRRRCAWYTPRHIDETDIESILGAGKPAPAPVAEIPASEEVLDCVAVDVTYLPQLTAPKLEVGSRIPWKNSPDPKENIREIEIVKLTPTIATVKWVDGSELQRLPRAAVEERLRNQSTPTTAPAPKPAPKPAQVSEGDKCRQWFAALDLANVYTEQSTSGVYYKYTVSVYNAGPDRVNHYYLFTQSPQQKSWHGRGAGSVIATGNTKADLQPALDRFLAERERKENARHERVTANKAARESFANPYNVGDFLYSSWGYDQTNREFYQVLEVRPTSIKVREVCQERSRDSYDGGNCSPSRDSFVDNEPERWISLQIDAQGRHSVPSPIHGNLYPWDGKPLYWSDGH